LGADGEQGDVVAASMRLTRPSNRGGRRGTATLATATVLVAVGGAAIGYAATDQQQPPQPGAAPFGSIDPVPGPSRPSAPAPGPSSAPGPPSDRTTSAYPLLAPSPPVSIRIPAIEVSSSMIDVGLNADGTIQVPQPGPDYDKAAWYKYSPTPGEVGSSVIEGHVDSAANGPSVFYRLGELRPGDEVYVHRQDGSVAAFGVTGIRRYDKDRFPTQQVYGPTGYPALRLITCGGEFDHAAGSYRDNTVVYAELTGVSRS
jgi:sortase (surface protein transpeptidase)